MDSYNKILDVAKEHKKVADKISSVVDLKNKTIVDVGGGSGLLAHYLKEHSKKISIIDSSSKMTSHVQDNFTIINKSIQELKVTKKYDVVLCFSSLHHFCSGHKDKINQIKLALEKMITLSKKEIILVEPNPYTLKGLYHKIQENVFLLQGCHYSSRAEFQELLKDHMVMIEEWRSHLVVHIKK